MRKSRIGELTELRPHAKTVAELAATRDAGKVHLLNFGTKHTVTMQWGMNEETERDQIIILKIGDKEAWLSKEDMYRFMRWV